MKPTEQFDKPFRAVKRFFVLVENGNTKKLIVLGIFSAGILLTDIALPWLLKDAIAPFISGGKIRGSIVIALLGLGLLRIILAFSHGSINGSYIADTISLLNKKMARRCVNKALPFSSRSATQVISLYSEAVFIVEQFLDSVLWQTGTHILYCVGAAGIVFYLGGPIVLLAFVPFAVAIFLGRKLRSKIENSLRKLHAQRGDTGNVFEDLIEGRSVLLAYQAEDAALGIFEKIERVTAKHRKNALVFLGFYQPFFEGVGLLAFMVIGFVGYQMTLRHPGEISTCVTSVLYLGFLARSLLSVAPLLPMWDRFKAAVRQIEELLDVPLEAHKELSRSYSARKAGVSLENLSFGYEASRNIFKSHTFKFEQGKTTAITGPNGIGKSTLLKLITGELRPLEGAVIVPEGPGGHRPKFAYLPQEPFLFRMSILENLRLIRPCVRKEEVLRLAEELGMESFLKARSSVLDREVGGRGLALSGGERQKVSLLRFALRAKESDLCLLDEPTSYIDLESEEALMAVVLKICSGKTTLLVSHREWLAKKCDRELNLGRT